MSEKMNELTETAKVILDNPAGKERFADAVSQVVARLSQIAAPKPLLINGKRSAHGL
jgi:hypothetical protein